MLLFCCLCSDLDKFDLNILESDFDAVQIAYELTSEIIIIEMIHRFVVIAYEVSHLMSTNSILIHI